MTDPSGACPVCGLGGCAAPVSGAEPVSPWLLAQIRLALALSVEPEALTAADGAGPGVAPGPARVQVGVRAGQ